MRTETEVGAFVGHRSDFALNEFKLVVIDDDEVGVVRTRKGFFAIRNHCPHGGAQICRGTITGTNLPSEPGQLRYGAHNSLVRCPWHGWEFHLDSGHAAFGLSRMRLITYPVIVEDDGSVFVERRKRKTSSLDDES